MDGWQTVRNQTIFGGIGYTETHQTIITFSDSDGEQTGGNTVFYEYVAVVDRDTSFTHISANNNGTYDDGKGGNGEAAGAGGSTTYFDLNGSSSSSSSSASQSDNHTDYSTKVSGFSFSSLLSDGGTTDGSTTFQAIDTDMTSEVSSTASSSTGSHDAATNTYTFGWIVSTDTSSAATINYTDNVDTTTLGYTVSGISGKSFLTTTSLSTTAVSNASTSFSDGTELVDYLLTKTTEVSFIAGSSTSEEFGQLQELGSVYKIGRFDWAWSFHELGTELPSYSYLTDIAETFSETTFWQAWTTSAVSVFNHGTAATTQSFTFAANSSSFTFEFLVTGDATTTTLTSGEKFPRDTFTTTVDVWTTSSDSAALGDESFEIDAYTTESNVQHIAHYRQATYFTSYPVGMDGAKSISLLTFETYLTTTMGAQVPPDLMNGSAGGGIEFGATSMATVLIAQNLATYELGAGNTYFAPTPPLGAFIAPQQLKDGSNTSFGGNLEIAGTTVDFPWLASVYSNVGVPDFASAFSTTGTNSHTYKFNWKGATLIYSDVSSFASGTHTLTTQTVSSGQFSTSSDLSTDYVSMQNGVLGGFAFNHEPATAYFPPRAVIGTSIGTDGSSTTYKTLATETASTTVSETVIVEQTIPAYIAYLGGDGGVQPFVVFNRN